MSLMVRILPVLRRSGQNCWLLTVLVGGHSPPYVDADGMDWLGAVFPLGCLPGNFRLGHSHRFARSGGPPEGGTPNAA